MGMSLFRRGREVFLRLSPNSQNDQSQARTRAAAVYRHADDAGLPAILPSQHRVSMGQGSVWIRRHR